MGFEVWIAIVIAASVLSGGVGYAFARRGAPKQSELDAMAAELDEARQQADSVQANVSEHFEQSALLFGKLAADYREFLDHFSASAQNLGLSEARARELIEQGFQPLLTHEAVDEAVVADASAEEAVETVEAVEAVEPAAAAEAVETAAAAEALETAETAETAETTDMTETAAESDLTAEEPAVAVSEVTVQMPEDAAEQVAEDARRKEARGLAEALGKESASREAEADSAEAARQSKTA